MNDRWFYESLFSPVRLGMRMKKVFYSGKTPFQKIKIIDTEGFGRVLVLDGVIQTTEKDEYIYHEMITHVPMFNSYNPEEVLIIGGGDGGVLREVLKHPVKKVYLVEIDKKVIDLSKKYLPRISQGAFDDKRVEIVIDDGAHFIKKYSGKFDVIIIDSSDPVGPAEILFKKRFYQDCYGSLSSSGIMVRQTGSTFFQFEEQVYSQRNARRIFPYTHFYFAAVPTYIGGFFSFFMCGKKSFKDLDEIKLRRKYQKRNLKTTYYNPDIHLASFALPNYMKEVG